MLKTYNIDEIRVILRNFTKIIV